jgi:hypothetical protein
VTQMSFPIQGPFEIAVRVKTLARAEQIRAQIRVLFPEAEVVVARPIPPTRGR